MASETSELTFVRCPSCRSLVPVSASRCRICNNPLDGAGAAKDGNAAKQPGRVRQKTFSASVDELMREDSPSERSAPPPAAVATPQSEPVFGDQGDHEEVDPLADFLQEFEAEASEPVGAVTPEAAQSGGAAVSDDSDDDDDFDSFLDELDSYDSSAESPAPSAPRGGVVAPVEEPPLAAISPRDESPSRDADSDLLADFMGNDDELDLDSAPEPVREVAPPAPEKRYSPDPSPAPPVRQDPPRQPEEKRPPPQQQPNQRQQAAQPQARTDRSQQERKGHRDHKNAHPHQGGQERRENPPRERRDPPRNEPRNQESRKGGAHEGGRPQEHARERHHDHAPSRSDAPVSGPKTGKMRPGRLFGWLVSFESPDGRAIELREGKFFVTGSSIRGTDLVIEDASISTPHALMSVSADNGLLIQDLMSERGVFVRSGQRGQYKREDGVVELKHGDWVRFGDVEFVVTVVPSER
ncbi:MAG: Inner rane component of cytoplasmic domain [Pseudomonadota bacterium]